MWGPPQSGEVDERTEFQKLVKGKFRRRRAKIGDVAELPTLRGLVYAQYTHQYPRSGGLVRVLEGFHDERPEDLGALVAGPLLFETLIAFKSMTFSGYVDIAGNVPVPEDRRPFPLFRTAQHLDPKTGLWSGWWLWDGDREWRIGELEPGQEHLPSTGLPNYALLIAWIEEGRRNAGICPPA